MINRANWNDVQAYLQYKAEITRRSVGTVRSNRAHLKHVLEWAGDKSLEKAPAIRPTLPAYMEGLTHHGDKKLSAAYLKAFFGVARHFLFWVGREYPTRYKKLTETWLDTLRTSPERSIQSVLVKRELYTEEEVLRLAQAGMAHEELTMRRVGAGAAMMFLSGMRIGAFLTLPIEGVDLEHYQVLQLPELGVATKRHKAAKTTLLQIPGLMEVVREWDTYVRARLPGTAYWYVALDRDAELRMEKPTQRARTEGRSDFRKALVKLCAEAGVEFKSAHKLRHGNAVWAIKHAQTMEEMKAISQNLMHANMGITDGIYGKLVNDDVQRAILNLGRKVDSGSVEQGDVERMIEETIRRVMKEKN